METFHLAQEHMYSFDGEIRKQQAGVAIGNVLGGALAVFSNQYIVKGKEKKNRSCHGNRPSVLGLDLGIQCLDGALLLLYLVSHLLNLLVSHVDTENENISFSQELHSACYY